MMLMDRILPRVCFLVRASVSVGGSRCLLLPRGRILALKGHMLMPKSRNMVLEGHLFMPKGRMSMLKG